MKKIIHAIFTDDGSGEKYHIGTVMVPEDWDTERLINEFWEEWRKEVEEPDSDSQFIDWLIDNKEGFEVPPMPVTYSLINS